MSTNAPVDLDTLFNTLDTKTRKGLQDFIRGSGDWYDGKGAEANKATKYFSPFLVSTSDLTRELALDQKVLERFVIDTSRTVTSIAERRDDLANLVSNTNTTFGAIAAQNVALDRALSLLPDTLRKANTTFVNLRSTLDDLDKLVAVSYPATKDLAPFLKELRPLVTEAKPTVAKLNTLIRKPGPEQRRYRAHRGPAAAGQPHRVRLPARDQDAQSGSAGFRVRAQLHARPGVMARQLRPAGLELRRQRALRARSADVPSLHVLGRHPHREPAVTEAERLRHRQSHPLPGRHRATRTRRLQPGGGGLLQSSLDPARPVRRLIYIALFVAIAPWLVIGVVDAAGGDDHSDGYFVRAIFDNASSLVPGEDVKIAGAAVGVVDSLEVTDDKKAAVTLRIDDEDFTPWKADAHCRSAHSR